MPLATTRLFDRAADVLAALELYAAQTSYLLPDRRYVSPGLPAVDCEQVTVHVERTYSFEGDLAAEVLQPHLPRAGFAARGATIVIQIFRCAPKADTQGTKIVLPDVADEEAAALSTYSDAVFVINALLAGEKNADLPGCSGLAIENWNSLGPNGGFVGGETRVRVTLLGP